MHNYSLPPTFRIDPELIRNIYGTIKNRIPQIIMRLQFWLIKKSNIQTYVIIVVLILTIASHYFIDQRIRKTQDYYTPVIYSLLILWVYYSLFYQEVLDENVNEKKYSKEKV
jgi:hypothetical protein